MTVTDLRPGSGSLTPEQRALVRSVPGLAERASYEISRAFGGDPRSRDRINQAHFGIFKAAASYDSDRGPFAQWAHLKAWGEIVTADRKAQKQKRLAAAGRVTGFRLLAAKRHRFDDISLEASDNELFGELVGLAQEQLVGELLGAAVASEEPAEGEDEYAEREAWALALEALQHVLGGLKPQHRELLLLFAHGHDIKAIAKDRGMDYSTLLDQFHGQLALARARLEGLNINRTPPPPPDAPSVLPAPSPSSRKGGSSSTGGENND